jgi:hypothetical protein
MSVDNEAAAPAGDSAQPVDHSLEGVLAQWRKDQEQEAAKPEGDKPEGDEAPVEEPGQEPEPAAGEADPEGEPSEPEGDDQKPDFIPGNALTRMQDGSVRPVGELKKAYGELQELKKAQPEIEAARQEIERERATLQQRAQQYDQLLSQVGQSGVPEPPSDELWDQDPITALQQQRRHEAARYQREQLAAQQQRRAEEEKTVRSAEQGKRLLTLNPDLRDPQKAQAFGKEFLETVESWGFSRGEIDVGSLDHRLIHHAVADRRDAQKWRQLEANKAKAAKKAEGAPAVQPPGRRLTPGENRDGQLKALKQRAIASGGQIDDVLAYKRALEPG